MPALGFGSSVGSRLPDLANFPQSGLVALYKCDERQGDKLADATGNYPAMTLSTGVALDAAAGDLLFADTTGMLAAFVGQPGIVVMGAEVITPAAVGSATVHHIITRNTSAVPACSLYLNETTTSGLFRVEATIQTARDGGGATETAINTGNTFRLVPSSHYQIVVRVDMTAATPHAIFAYRRGTTGNWREFTVNGGTAGTHIIAGTGATRLLAYYNAANPFKGKIIAAFAAAEDIPMTTAQTVLDRFGVTAVKNVLGTSHARFWDFRFGTGTKCHELITNTYETVSGTVAWTNSLSGCTQPTLRQGLPYYGKPGVLLGGQDGYGAEGGGAVSTSYGNPVGSTDGWTVQATFRVGNHLPTAETVIASFYGPDSAGNIPAIGSLPGVHFTLSAAGVILCRMKYIANATADTGTGVNVTAGAGTAVAANGLLTTFTAVCSSAGAVDVYRQHIGETTPTLAASFTTNTLAIATRADRAAIGQASMDGEALVGFLAAWSRPLTVAEMAQCHKSATARMTGQELYVSSASTIVGNGSELYPYSDTLPALRVHQPNQICNWATGSYTRFNQSVATTRPSSDSNITWRGTGSPTFAPGAGLPDYPTILQTGSWTFSGIVWDANSTAFYAMTVDDTVTSIEFINCEWKNGHKWVDGVDPGDQGYTTATGSGMTCRCPDSTIVNCAATDNDEHGVYFRLAGEDSPDGTFSVDGLTVTGSGEDGLKVTNETAYGARWRNCIVNKLKVTGGKNQLYLLGMSDSVVTNILLIDQDSVAPETAAAYLGKPQGVVAEELQSDYPLERVTVANITITGSANHGIWVQGDLASGSVTIKNAICEGNAHDFEDDTTAGTVSITYSAGDSATDPIPAGTGNIPGADIAFTNAAGGVYTLTALSDGYAVGVNLWNLSNEINSDYAGTARPVTGAWDMGALQHAEA